MSLHLSKRVTDLQPSPTFAVMERVKQLTAEGVRVYDLASGEPDFDTPDHIKLAAAAALEAGDTKYTPTAGKPVLRKAVAEWETKLYGQATSETEVIICSGGKHALFNTFGSILSPGEEVVVPAPYWVSVPHFVTFHGGTPVIVNCPIEQGFKITPEQLRKAMTKDTRAVYINSPSNPTGACYSPEELRSLVAVVAEHPEALIVSDEIYECLTLDESTKHTSLRSLVPEMSARIIKISGVSKTFAMTGWRIGWAIAEPRYISGMSKMQSLSTSNATSFAMAASAVALTSDLGFLADWIEAYKHRRDIVCEAIAQMPGMRVTKPQGAFYCFPRIPDSYTPKDPEQSRSVQFAEDLLEDQRVAVVAGSAFGTEDHIRISYATDEDTIRTAMDRLAAFVR
jgi:aspartate aminotransferase